MWELLLLWYEQRNDFPRHDTVRVKSVLIRATFFGLLSLASATAQVAPEAVPPAPLLAVEFAPDGSSGRSQESGHQSPAQGTRPQNHQGLIGVIQRGALDQKEIYLAPLHRKNLKWDAIFLLSTGGLIAADKHVAGAIPRDSLSVSQHISDIGLYSTLATTGFVLVSGLKNNNETAREAGILGFEAAANTLAVEAVSQLIAGRERPLEGAGQGRFWVNNTVDSSFPSIHSGLTWSLVSVLAHEYPRPWVQLLGYGTATTVSVTRVTGLKHFPADVAVGGIFGYFIGRHIFHTHSRHFE